MLTKSTISKRQIERNLRFTSLEIICFQDVGTARQTTDNMKTAHVLPATAVMNMIVVGGCS
jgi:hypothetical protein